MSSKYREAIVSREIDHYQLNRDRHNLSLKQFIQNKLLYKCIKGDNLKIMRLRDSFYDYNFVDMID